MIQKTTFLFFLFIQSFLFSQELEEAIYNATETFISNKNEETFQLLKKQVSIFKTQVKTKDEQLALIFLQSHKAYFLQEQSKLKEAISTYEDAVNRFYKNKLSNFSDFDIIESCLKPLGNLYTKINDFTNAINTINRYIFLAKQQDNKLHQISGYINLSQLYYTLGKHKYVIATVNDALKLGTIHNFQKKHLETIKTASLIALKQYKVNSNSNNSSLQEEKNNYLLQLQKGNYNQALIAFRNYKASQIKTLLSKRDLSQLHIEEAQLYFLLKESDKSLTHLKKAIKALLPNFKGNGLPNKSLLYAENQFIAIFDLLAEIETDYQKALQSFDLSFYVSELLRKNWTSQETKILNDTDNRIRSEKCIAILFNAYNQTKNKALLYKAFQYSENNKASVLKDIAKKKLRLQQQPKDSLLIKEFELIKHQEQITNLLIKEQLGANESSKINSLSEELKHISYQLKTLQNNISEKYSETNTNYTLNELQQKLQKDNAALVEYFYGKNYLYQFIISDKHIDLTQISLDNNTRESIVKFIHLFDNASIINNNVTNYSQLAFNIYNMLKFNKLHSYKNTIIIPDGLLNFIPFEALLTSKTKTTSYSKMPFVVLNQNIAYNTSTYFYLNATKSKKKRKILGFFPVFKTTKQALSYSINEAKAIEKEMEIDLFMNSNASKANFIKNAPSFNILHLSTHASGGDFTNPASIAFYDDILTLNEIYSLDLNANLVVLSACETGVGKLYKAEGVMSVARGFQFAGVKNLIFSLWQINDLSTSKIMQLFYKNYNKYQSAFTANCYSKIAYLKDESISNAKKSPYYWSAFVYYGEVSKPIKNYMPFYIIFGILILLIIVLLILKYKKHG